MSTSLGDWSDVDAEDWEANERALREGKWLLSVYLSTGGVKFYVITEMAPQRDDIAFSGGLFNVQLILKMRKSKACLK
jgi:hypothetical protein